MRTLVGIPCLFGAAHTKEAIDSVVNQNGVTHILKGGLMEDIQKRFTVSLETQKQIIADANTI